MAGRSAIAPWRESTQNVPMSAPQLNLVVIRSPDIHRAAKFYQAMGLQLMMHRHGAGPEHYAAEANGLVFELYPATAKSGSTQGTRIGFRVEAIDAVVERVREAGAEIVTPPQDSEWGRRAVVRDLDGHVIELTATKPPSNG